MGWLAHLVVDVALGVGLLVAGAHGTNADYFVLDAAGGYLLVVCALTAGRGRRFRRLPRPLHRLLDGLVALLLLASPAIVLAAHVHLDLFATAMAEAVGVILARDALVTGRRARPARGAPAAPIETRAYEREAETPPPSPPEHFARRLGRASAGAAAQVPGAARRAGLVAGRAGRAAKRAGESARRRAE